MVLCVCVCVFKLLTLGASSQSWFRVKTTYLKCLFCISTHRGLLGMFYLLPLVSLSRLDEAPPLRHLDFHPSLGRESLPACPTDSVCALIIWGRWRPLKLTPHEVDLSRDLGTELVGRKLANSPQWCQCERFLPSLCTSHRRKPWLYLYP